jgi:hypothetical protein
VTKVRTKVSKGVVVQNSTEQVYFLKVVQRRHVARYEQVLDKLTDLSKIDGNWQIESADNPLGDGYVKCLLGNSGRHFILTSETPPISYGLVNTKLADGQHEVTAIEGVSLKVTGKFVVTVKSGRIAAMRYDKR